ncbi:hypothetical protein QTI66_29675 [Variovorax sp. J22R133]|uniref:DUF6868 family protein n=1 Tax=Variovorax brevis TaxID=3053503 RepID=UPI0025759EDB|nr:hypothetical protein [Variovorax sp. J22R133]MDM0116331.1 hypothetical protein [Variovorax sp. J22R133]
MRIQIWSAFLLGCTLINYSMLIAWFVAFSFAHEWMFRLHGNFFHISRERFDGIHYAGMVAYKVAILLFNLVPFVALRLL